MDKREYVYGKGRGIYPPRELKLANLPGRMQGVGEHIVHRLLFSGTALCLGPCSRLLFSGRECLGRGYQEGNSKGIFTSDYFSLATAFLQNARMRYCALAKFQPPA